MPEFRVELDSRIDATAKSEATIVSLSKKDVTRIMQQFPGRYSISYQIDGRTFSYYPAPLLVILGDLDEELKNLRERKPHSMRLSGYRVLDVIFTCGEEVQFRDPLALDAAGERELVASVDYSDVERALQDAVRTLLAVIEAPKH